jgi:acetyl-CoA/propionyl-CoA carboxylase biotin carboxyl carrier protein
VVEGPATVIPFDLLALDDAAFATDTFAVHTQWIESTLLPRLEPQLRPAPAPAAALQRFPVEIDGRRVVLGLPIALLAGLGGLADAGPAPSASDPTELRSPAPGTLVRWLADDGTHVAEGDPVAVLDAMKMETTVAAHRAGVLSHRAELSAAIAPDGVIAVID